MKKIIFAIALSTLVFGCRKTDSEKAIVALKHQACACKDTVCADAVGQKLDDAMEEFDEDFEKEVHDPTAAAKLAAMAEAVDCLAKLK